MIVVVVIVVVVVVEVVVVVVVVVDCSQVISASLGLLPSLFFHGRASNILMEEHKLFASLC